MITTKKIAEVKYMILLISLMTRAIRKRRIPLPLLCGSEHYFLYLPVCLYRRTNQSQGVWGKE